jgi:hypothetical protein
MSEGRESWTGDVRLVLCTARLGPKPGASAWLRGALASEKSKPGPTCGLRLGFGPAWPGPGLVSSMYGCQAREEGEVEGDSIVVVVVVVTSCRRVIPR